MVRLYRRSIHAGAPAAQAIGRGPIVSPAAPA